MEIILIAIRRLHHSAETGQPSEPVPPWQPVYWLSPSSRSSLQCLYPLTLVAEPSVRNTNEGRKQLNFSPFLPFLPFHSFEQTSGDSFLGCNLHITEGKNDDAICTWSKTSEELAFCTHYSIPNFLSAGHPADYQSLSWRRRRKLIYRFWHTDALHFSKMVLRTGSYL